MVAVAASMEAGSTAAADILMATMEDLEIGMVAITSGVAVATTTPLIITTILAHRMTAVVIITQTPTTTTTPMMITDSISV